MGLLSGPQSQACSDKFWAPSWLSREDQLKWVWRTKPTAHWFDQGIYHFEDLESQVKVTGE